MSDSISSKPSSESAEGKEGCEAFLIGVAEDDCPYLNGQRRMDWFAGYFLARTARRMKKILERV